MSKILFLDLDGTDRPEDQQAANNANIPFMWAEEWRNGK